jgi:hypothetical protein
VERNNKGSNKRRRIRGEGQEEGGRRGEGKGKERMARHGESDHTHLLDANH